MVHSLRHHDPRENRSLPGAARQRRVRRRIGRDLVPYGHRVCGWSVGADQRTMTAFIPEEFRPKLIGSLRENGELAVTVEEFPSHETYQFRAVRPRS